MTRTLSRVVVALVLAVLFSPTARSADTLSTERSIPPVSACSVDPGRIKILVTNDVHGRVYEDKDKNQIGYPLLRGRIEEAVREGYTVYLFDAGDAVSGNAIAQFDNGSSVASLMGEMGYRVICPGNHAFDFNEALDDPLYYSDTLLASMRGNASGPFDAVCLNLTYDGGDVPGISRRPVVVQDDGGIRLVVVGLLTPYTRKSHNMRGVAGYEFGLVENANGPDHEATKKNILGLLETAIRGYSCPGDVVVVLSHIGMDDSEDYGDGQITGRDLASVPNVDFVVDAHTHNLIQPEAIGDALYGIADRYLTHVAELTIAAENGSVAKTMELRSYDDMAQYDRSEAVITRLREIADRLGMDEQLFELPPPAFVDDTVNEESLPIARLLCKGMAELAGCDLAVVNAGNIRSSLMPGWVTTGSVYDVIPYQNNLVTFSLTGREIIQALAPKLKRKTNAFPQVWGITMYAYESGGDMLELAGILDRSGKPINPDRLYSVAINDFIAFGGDGYAFNTSRPLRHLGDMTTAFVVYLRNRGEDAARAVRENDALLVFPGRAEAEQAFAATVKSVHHK